MKGARPGPAESKTVPAYWLAAVESVCADREAELMELKGPCRVARCRLHRAHRGPCDIRPAEEPS